MLVDGEGGSMSLPWGWGRERWHCPIPHMDHFKDEYVAELHEEDITPLNLSLPERLEEAKKWKVLYDACTAEIYYANTVTLETRWHLPRGLRYMDLHSHDRTQHLCHLVVPDDVPAHLWDVPWGQLILAARGNGNWTEYRARREAYENHLRRTLYTSPPSTRVYFRLTEPHRFQGEANNDDNNHNNHNGEDNDDDAHDHDHDNNNNNNNNNKNIIITIIISIIITIIIMIIMMRIMMMIIIKIKVRRRGHLRRTIRGRQGHRPRGTWA